MNAPTSDFADGTVFIVDDDDAVRASLEMLVRSLGFRSEGYSSGEDFLDAYDGKRSGCVLLDIRMPGMNGFEVQRQLDAMNAAIPVIFLTAEGADEAATQDAGERIQKPFRDQELVDKIRELVDG